MADRRSGSSYRLPCPRCDGPISYLEGAAAIACPYCRNRFFVGDDAGCGWTLAPRYRPEELVSAAKRWLRERGERVTAFGKPEGWLVPVYWLRGRQGVWKVRGRARPAVRVEPGDLRILVGRFLAGREEAAEPEAVEEAHFSVRAYAHALPAHPLARATRGWTTRLASQMLTLLDPDDLPEGYGLLAPAHSREEARENAATWLTKWEAGKFRGQVACARSFTHRLNLVAVPLVTLPFAFRKEREGLVVVDGVSGAVHTSLPGSMHPGAGPSRETPPAFERPPLLPLECRSCGWVLELAERDRIHPCPHCGRAWELTGGSAREVREWLLPGAPGAEGRHLPFWVFGEGAERRLVPAYGARHPGAQISLSATLTRRLEEDATWEPPPPGPRPGAVVGSDEARGWSWALRGSLARERWATFLRYLEQAPGEETAPRGILWVPFRREGPDLVHAATGARIGRRGTQPWGLPQAA